MKETHAARLLTVVLATAGLSACSGSVDTLGAGGTTAGSTSSGGGGAGGDAGVYDAPGDGLISDAVPPPLECSVVKEGQMIGPSATLDAGTLTIDLGFKDYVEGAIAWSATPSISVAPELGALGAVTVQGTSLTLTVTLTPGATKGTVTLTGDLAGFGPPPGYAQITCPVTRVFNVDLGGASPQIAEAAPLVPLPIDQRPRFALALVGADGLRARVHAAGVPEGAAVEIDATGGEARREGAFVDWVLPAEPGLYQLEVVVRRGRSIATSALAVEVKEA